MKITSQVLGFVGLSLLSFMGSLGAQEAAPPTENVLRVCADPADLPFSDQNRQGFENKIAEVVAQAMGARLEYYWWPYQRGLVRRTLEEDKCDVLINVPTEWEMVLTTRPYYRTTYVLVWKVDSEFEVSSSLQDSILRKVRVGVHLNTPPHVLLAEHGIVENLIVYSLTYDPQFHPEDYPGKLVEDLLAGKVDVAVVWGPIAGYFARKKGAPLRIVPVPDENPRIPMAFNMSMGVRRGNKALKARLEEILTIKEAEIRAILEDYGVPLLEIQPAREKPAPSKEGHRHPG
ncbi:MAG: substrate-binding domain-containing protein [Acidobacteria bacterium]|nr:substrate-binding domain-containing protein [Acidobacteriota bacterium]MDW7984904.1 substrate-binding domain-containing protein [Acidobacteriota bacterium]